MNWRTLVILALVVALGVLVWAFLGVRAEPVEQISDKWASSGHANAEAEAFVNWNEDDPPEIPPRCAKCHGTYGYLDFLGVDGTAAGTVDNSSKTGSVIYCNVCHNDAAHQMTSVTFPSGVSVPGLGRESSCMQCHQGLASTETVDEAIADQDVDTVNPELEFVNVHYNVGAATQRGGVTRGAYQYENAEYVGQFDHVEDLSTCIECHDPHALDIDPRKCSPCHVAVVNEESLEGIRTSATDYDGDGNAQEGMAGEIETLHETLYRAMQDYAATVAGAPLVYGRGTFPYWFVDTNGNRQADADETVFPNQYASWTPRLLRAAYNYHFVVEDPGVYTHNPRYVLQILYDGLNDLGQEVSVDTARMTRP